MLPRKIITKIYYHWTSYHILASLRKLYLFLHNKLMHCNQLLASGKFFAVCNCYVSKSEFQQTCIKHKVYFFKFQIETMISKQQFLLKRLTFTEADIFRLVEKQSIYFDNS